MMLQNLTRGLLSAITIIPNGGKSIVTSPKKTVEEVAGARI